MTSNIFVIGSGNIGSRHVQSLANSVLNLNVFVVDPNKECLEKTKNLFFKQKIKSKINISFSTTISKINESIDLAIISTNSTVRREVIEQLVSINHVKNIILEKVAFQSINDFDSINKLFEKKKIKSYLNFPRRVYRSYQNIKKKFQNENKIYVSNIDVRLSLSSHSLHMLDLLAYLTDTNKIFVEDVLLKNEIYNSSRGSVEFAGKLKFSTERGDTLYLCDQDRDKDKKNLGVTKIESKNLSCFIYENYQKIVQIEFDKNNFKTETFEIPFQSMLTYSIVDELLMKNKISLTKLKDSYNHHKILLEIFTNHIHKCDLKITGCPIS